MHASSFGIAATFALALAFSVAGTVHMCELIQAA